MLMANGAQLGSHNIRLSWGRKPVSNAFPLCSLSLSPSLSIFGNLLHRRISLSLSLSVHSQTELYIFLPIFFQSLTKETLSTLYTLYLSLFISLTLHTTQNPSLYIHIHTQTLYIDTLSLCVYIYACLISISPSYAGSFLAFSLSLSLSIYIYIYVYILSLICIPSLAVYTSLYRHYLSRLLSHLSLYASLLSVSPAHWRSSLYQHYSSLRSLPVVLNALSLSNCTCFVIFRVNRRQASGVGHNMDTGKEGMMPLWPTGKEDMSLKMLMLLLLSPLILHMLRTPHIPATLSSRFVSLTYL